MFRGPSLIVSTMQEETTPIFKRLWYDWTQQQPGIEPTNPLGQCWVPPIVAFYDQQGLLRTYSLPGGSIRVRVTPFGLRGLQDRVFVPRREGQSHPAHLVLRAGELGVRWELNRLHFVAGVQDQGEGGESKVGGGEVTVPWYGNSSL